MDDNDKPQSAIDRLIQRIETSWEVIYQTLEEDDAPAAEYLKGTSYKDFGKAIFEVLIWLRSISSTPERRKRSRLFKLAKSSLIARGKSLATKLEKIRAGEYSHFATIAGDITQMVGSLAALTAFLPKRDVIEEAAVAGHLAVDIADLHEKVELTDAILSKLDSASADAESVQATKTDTDKLFVDVRRLHGAIVRYKEIIEQRGEACSSTTKDTLDKTIVMLDKSEKVLVAADEAKATAEESIRATNEATKELDALTSRAEEILNTAQGLLPQATSAGLASAFDDRASEVAKSLKPWVFGFAAGILLIVVAITAVFAYDPISDGQINWSTLLPRAVFAGPGIWVAWFCARGMSTTLKLRESYANKAALSRAFEGYKKQFVELDETERNGTLASELSANVLLALAQDPVQIMNKPDEDGHSPVESFVRRFRKKPGIARKTPTKPTVPVHRSVDDGVSSEAESLEVADRLGQLSESNDSG